MLIKIEKIKPEDLEEFWQVFCQVIKNDFPGYSQMVINNFLNVIYTRSSFNYWLSQGSKIILIAKVKKEIVGFAVLDKPYGGVCFLRWLGVLPQYRKKTIGRKLIVEWEKFSRDYGCHKLEVASQENAKTFYRKAGLNLEGKRPLSYFGIDQYIFGKAIGKPDDIIMTRD